MANRTVWLYDPHAHVPSLSCRDRTPEGNGGGGGGGVPLLIRFHTAARLSTLHTQIENAFQFFPPARVDLPGMLTGSEQEGLLRSCL